MQDKKAIAPSVLVVLIAMVVVFIILFRIDMLIVNIITGGSEDQICFWSASLSSFQCLECGDRSYDTSLAHPF